MTANLKGKVAIVTGSSGGIGRAAAIELASMGAKVAVNYFENSRGAEETAALIREAGGESIVVQADVTNIVQIEKLVAETKRAFSSIDILVNNAGNLVERRPIEQMDEDLWHKIMNVNVTSTVFMTKAVIPEMKAKQAGAIVNMSSLAAHNGGGNGAVPYATAKGAIISLTKGLAKELAPYGIRVNCVAPGFIDNTKFHATFSTAESRKATVQSIPLGRGGIPEDVAQAIAFLASEQSSFITGETIEINGGVFMR